MASIFVIKKGLYFWTENCQQCNNDDFLLAEGDDLFLVICPCCSRIDGLFAIWEAKLVLVFKGSDSDVREAWEIYKYARTLSDRLNREFGIY